MMKFNRNTIGLLIVLFSISSLASAQVLVYNVKKYGAKGDGKSLDNKAIDKAIDAANAAGGGTVYFPAGDYLSVTIHLKSNVALYIDQGATIIAATPGEGIQYDLPEKGDNEIYQDYGHSHFHNSLIVGENLHDIAITGPGRIWGRGLVKDEGKPGQNDGVGNKTLSLKLCRNVMLKDFTVVHGGWFCFLLTAVDNTTIDNIKMDTGRDGIDLISSKNVHISNTTINAPGDDALVLKCDYSLNYPRVLENVTITNCQVSGYNEGTFLDGTFLKDGRKNPMGRIKLGTESNGGYKNIAITNCVFDHCRGLALETVDGAVLEDITISNIVMHDIGNAPIFIRLGARQRAPKDFPYSQLRRVLISNIVADVTGDQGAIISGIPGHDIEDLTLSNIHLYVKGGGTKEQAAREMPALISNYPEPDAFGVTPAYGFFIRNVRDLKMNDVEVNYSKEDQRPAFVLDQVKNFNFVNSPQLPDTKLAEVDKLALEIPKTSATPCMDILGLFTAANVPAMAPQEEPATLISSTEPTPPNLPGKGLAQHPMLYIGENCNRMSLVKDGKVIWTYNTGKGPEYDDVWMLSNGNILFTRMQYVALMTPDKKILWRYDCNNSRDSTHTEVHTCQPIGFDKVMFVVNGLPPKLFVVNINTGKIEVEHVLPSNQPPTVGDIHPQVRRARYTAQGTYLVSLLNQGRVVEYDKDFKEIWSYKTPKPWAALRLKNGNTLITDEAGYTTREVDTRGETVWEFNCKTDLPAEYQFASAPQTCTRLANGNTIFTSRGQGGRGPQLIEVDKDKKVVWVLHDWQDVGDGTALQVLDDPGVPEIPGQSEH